MMKLIFTILTVFSLMFAEDSVVSVGYLKFPKDVVQNGGLFYQVVCIDGYKFLVVTRSPDSVSVVQMREINSSGNEKVMKCESSSEK